MKGFECGLEAHFRKMEVIDSNFCSQQYHLKAGLVLIIIHFIFCLQSELSSRGFLGFPVIFVLEFSAWCAKSEFFVCCSYLGQSELLKRISVLERKSLIQSNYYYNILTRNQKTGHACSEYYSFSFSFQKSNKYVVSNKSM